MVGFSLVILIRHAHGFVSAYSGDITAFAVAAQESVRAGQPIAVTRTADGESGARLRFELRKGAAVLDPVRYLPCR